MIKDRRAEIMTLGFGGMFNVHAKLTNTEGPEIEKEKYRKKFRPWRRL